MFLPVTVNTPSAEASKGSVSVILNFIKFERIYVQPYISPFWHKKKDYCASFSTVTAARFPFHFIKKYNCPLTSNRVSYIIWSFHIVEPAGFSTFPQHPCGKPEDGRAMRPKRSLACAWALLIPHPYYKRIRCICQACVEINIKLKVYCLRAPMHIHCGPMHIYFAAACGHRCILPADRKYMACGGDAHIPRSTSRPS